MFNALYIIETSKKVENAVIALSFLESLLVGARNTSDVIRMISDEHISTLKALFSSTTNQSEEHASTQLDPYMITAFKAFTQNTTKITIHYYNFDHNDMADDIQKLLMYRVQRSHTMRKDDDLTNLFRPQVFSIFTEIRRITLITTNFIGTKSWSLSLIGFLSLIKNTMVQHVQILARGEDSWIRKLLSSSMSNLLGIFSSANYKIEFKAKIGFKRRYDGFVITRKQ